MTIELTFYIIIGLIIILSFFLMRELLAEIIIKCNKKVTEFYTTITIFTYLIIIFIIVNSLIYKKSIMIEKYISKNVIVTEDTMKLDKNIKLNDLDNLPDFYKIKINNDTYYKINTNTQKLITKGFKINDEIDLINDRKSFIELSIKYYKFKNKNNKFYKNIIEKYDNSYFVTIDKIHLY